MSQTARTSRTTVLLRPRHRERTCPNGLRPGQYLGRAHGLAVGVHRCRSWRSTLGTAPPTDSPPGSVSCRKPPGHSEVLFTPQRRAASSTSVVSTRSVRGRGRKLASCDRGWMADGTTKGVLRYALAAQRRHVLGVTDGLSDVQWQTPALPSGWTPAALVTHLALDVERWWFRLIMDGGLAYEGVSKIDGWQQAAGLTGAEVNARYLAACADADAVIEAATLDTPPACWPPEVFGEFRLADLREVLLHVITETACHAGHLDAARELLDGRQWLVLD